MSPGRIAGMVALLVAAALTFLLMARALPSVTVLTAATASLLAIDRDERVLRRLGRGHEELAA